MSEVIRQAPLYPIKLARNGGGRPLAGTLPPPLQLAQLVAYKMCPLGGNAIPATSRPPTVSWVWSETRRLAACSGKLRLLPPSMLHAQVLHVQSAVSWVGPLRTQPCAVLSHSSCTI